MGDNATCENCGRELYSNEKDICTPCVKELELCEDCAFSEAMSGVEPPEGGWPKYSDMDMI